MSVQSIRCLLIEDNPIDVKIIKYCLTEVVQFKFHVHWANCLSDGLKKIAKETYDIVLLDLSLPDSKDIDTFKQVFENIDNTPIIVITANEDEKLANQISVEFKLPLIVTTDYEFSDTQKI